MALLQSFDNGDILASLSDERGDLARLSDARELTVDMAKKLLSTVTWRMQDEIRCNGSPAAGRDEVLRGWGLDDAAAFEDCLRSCCKGTEDPFLRAWLALYYELARTAEPMPTLLEADRRARRVPSRDTDEWACVD
mmetsp:Transcript_91437/g.175338  ORF Transcript_91437/g.175338 Transcript_91437/m.175338 type:complete len:136 (-) Transcript_91437:104-511(-)